MTENNKNNSQMSKPGKKLLTTEPKKDQSLGVKLSPAKIEKKYSQSLVKDNYFDHHGKIPKPRRNTPKEQAKALKKLKRKNSKFHDNSQGNTSPNYLRKGKGDVI